MSQGEYGGGARDAGAFRGSGLLVLSTVERGTIMKITVIKKADTKKTPKRGCPWMIDDMATEK
jgi:hypothetical protein